MDNICLKAITRSNSEFLLINAEVTLRMGRIGLFGGGGAGLWFTNYNATLRDTFNDEKDSKANYMMP